MAENYFGSTDTGRVRTNNEDTFIAQPVNGSNLILAGVIDGVGGYNGGEVAAAIARDQMIGQAYGASEDIIPAMIDSFRLASQQIFAKRQEDRELESMACVATLAVVDVQKNQFHYAHVGDTRLYLLRDHSLVKISKDHSFVGFLEDSGRLTEQAAMDHPKRNEINKALGFNSQIDTDDSYIETGQSPFLPGDMLLLCSDGLTDMVNREEIIGIITQKVSLREMTGKLIELANANGGKDNVTVVLVQNDKQTQARAGTMPVAGGLKKKDPQNEMTGTLVSEPVGKKPVQESAPVAAPKNNMGLLFGLFFACMLLLAAVIWLFLQLRAKDQVIADVPVKTAPVQKARNADELKLQAAIDQVKGDTLFLSDTVFKQPVVISDSLHISKDSLYIKVKGNIVLKSDTGYKGPALVLATGCKYTVVDKLIMEGFETGIKLTDNTLILKNVQFRNCRMPVQKGFTYPADRLITSYLPLTTFRADTIVNINKPVPATPKPANGTR